MGKSYILCVDDDKTILISLKAQLKYSFGDTFQYELAESADEAWEVIRDLKAEGEKVAVVISDWIMPKVRGDEFLIGVHNEYPEIVTLMLTGHANEDAIQKAKEHANLSGCLIKPWKVDELINIITTALSMPKLQPTSNQQGSSNE